jgi:hypothetical protein
VFFRTAVALIRVLMEKWERERPREIEPSEFRAWLGFRATQDKGLHVIFEYLHAVGTSLLLDRAIRSRDLDLVIACAADFLPLAFERGRIHYQPVIIRLIDMWRSANDATRHELRQAMFRASPHGVVLAADEYQETMNKV